MKRQISQKLAAPRCEVVRLAQTGRNQAAIASHLRIPLCPSANRTTQMPIDGGGLIQPLVSPGKIPKDNAQVEGAR